MIEGLVVAAGLSSRTKGTNKLLLRISGEPLVCRTVRGLLEYCGSVTVVTGYDKHLIEEALVPLKGVRIVYNPDYKSGMLSSIKCGLSTITAGKCLFTPADSPFAPSDAIGKVAASGARIAVASYGGKPGHPVMLSRYAIDRLLSSDTFESLRGFIAANEHELVETGSAEVLIDVDTIEDYEEAIRAIGLNR